MVRMKCKRTQTKLGSYDTFVYTCVRQIVRELHLQEIIADDTTLNQPPTNQPYIYIYIYIAAPSALVIIINM